MVKYVVCSFLSFTNAIKIGKALVVTFEVNLFCKRNNLHQCLLSEQITFNICGLTIDEASPPYVNGNKSKHQTTRPHIL
jgi:hypothetical protein